MAVQAFLFPSPASLYFPSHILVPMTSLHIRACYLLLKKTVDDIGETLKMLLSIVNVLITVLGPDLLDFFRDLPYFLYITGDEGRDLTPFLKYPYSIVS